MSTALDAAIPAISVSGGVATARIASATSPSARDRGARPSAAWWNRSWASRNSAGPPNARIVKPSVSVYVPHSPMAPASSEVSAARAPSGSTRWSTARRRPRAPGSPSRRRCAGRRARPGGARAARSRRRTRGRRTAPAGRPRARRRASRETAILIASILGSGHCDTVESPDDSGLAAAPSFMTMSDPPVRASRSTGGRLA
jgi:hypothetical protein